jgi:glycosyltransferase involved in cell wall biosynthesis
LSPRGALIYHNFDLTAPEDLGPLGRLLKQIETKGARRSDRVIVSSKERAVLFQREARLAREPVVLMNCQRVHSPRKTTGELMSLLNGRGIQFDRMVVRLGSIVPGNAIEPVIQSLPLWPEGAGLILAGGSDPPFLERMMQVAAELGVNDRVVFLPAVSYSLWYDILYSAHLGIALYEPNNVNNRSMAGAGNKLNLYLKAGIPAILPDLPDFDSFRRRFDVGPAAVPTDPESIAAAVHALLRDPDRYARCCQAARRAFESEYNFETQFQPILDLVLGSAGSPTVPAADYVR